MHCSNWPSLDKICLCNNDIIKDQMTHFGTLSLSKINLERIQLSSVLMKAVPNVIKKLLIIIWSFCLSFVKFQKIINNYQIIIYRIWLILLNKKSNTNINKNNIQINSVINLFTIIQMLLVLLLELFYKFRIKRKCLNM